MPATVPIRDMKDTSSFTRLVERERQVTVTRNGYDAIYCTSADQHRADQEQIARAQVLSRILLAEDQISSGAYRSYDEFVADLRGSYGL